MRQRIAAGLVHWPDLAARAGLPAEGWTPALLASRRDARGDRTVIALRHPHLGQVVCKQGLRDGDAAAMARSAAVQDRAARALAGHPQAGVPQVLAQLPDRAALLMEAVAGPTLMQAATAAAGPAALAAVLRRAGVWTDAFHRAGPVEVRAFQPRFMADHFAQVAAEVRAGRHKVARRADFLRHVAVLLSRAAAAQGAATLSSCHHGDLTARNLILGTHRSWGIDLAGDATRPVGYDIARLLVYLVEKLDTVPGAVPAAGVVPDDMLAAFFDGYRLIGADDATLRFLIPARLMSDWLSMPPARSAMSLTELGRFARICRLAAAALA